MIRDLVEKIFGKGSWEDVDHGAVERQLEEKREAVAYDYPRAGEYPYGHYTEAVDDVKQLKRERRHDEVEDLLLWCIDYVEREAEHHEGIPSEFPAISPAYYRHLAIVYRKEDRYDDEVAVLERYVSACRTIGQGPNQDLVDRCDRARELSEEAVDEGE